MRSRSREITVNLRAVSPDDDSDEARAFGAIELDALRGWREYRDPALRAPHALPALARLIALDSNAKPRFELSIHGPEILLGRYATTYGPVDLLPDRLEDYELYRLGAPHLQLRLEDDGSWRLRALAPQVTTRIAGREVLPNQAALIADGDVLELGVVRFRFEKCKTELKEWSKRRRALLARAREPALYLMRHGGPCGPFIEFDGQRSLVVGRSFPQESDLFGAHSCKGYDPPDWDLAGLHEGERRFIGFRHISVERHGDTYTLIPLGARQRCSLNRTEIRGPTPLSDGDEIGLGTVLLSFRLPGMEPAQPKPLPMPAIVDWSQEHSSSVIDDEDALADDDGTEDPSPDREA